MWNTTHNHEHEHFPCDCHRPEYAYTDSLCPMCEENAEREREAKRGGEMAEPEIVTDEEMERLSREADNAAFTDAASRMSREDWDADNDWLASAGWGEM